MKTKNKNKKKLLSLIIALLTSCTLQQNQQINQQKTLFFESSLSRQPIYIPGNILERVISSYPYSSTDQNRTKGDWECDKKVKISRLDLKKWNELDEFTFAQSLKVSPWLEKKIFEWSTIQKLETIPTLNDLSPQYAERFLAEATEIARTNSSPYPLDQDSSSIVELIHIEELIAISNIDSVWKNWFKKKEWGQVRPVLVSQCMRHHEIDQWVRDKIGNELERLAPHYLSLSWSTPFNELFEQQNHPLLWANFIFPKAKKIILVSPKVKTTIPKQSLPFWLKGVTKRIYR